jgi:hypothetical protein
MDWTFAETPFSAIPDPIVAPSQLSETVSFGRLLRNGCLVRGGTGLQLKQLTVQSEQTGNNGCVAKDTCFGACEPGRQEP